MLAYIAIIEKLSDKELKNLVNATEKRVRLEDSSFITKDTGNLIILDEIIVTRLLKDMLSTN